MPIAITTNELTANHKRDVRTEFEVILELLNSEQLDNYQHLIEMIIKLGNERSNFKKELSNYLMAIYTFLELPEEEWAHRLYTFPFKQKYQKQLLASLMYFLEPNNVIPNHIAYIGYLDDAYCVNLALSKQSSHVKDVIEAMVIDLESGG
jgi:uncharacterized membrane protein YkvA (DUF1232 family)